VIHDKDKLVRVEVLLPNEMSLKLRQLRLIAGYRKRDVIRRALEMLFERGDNIRKIL
jgi:hypothetical protein